jgi:hypothetical protein
VHTEARNQNGIVLIRRELLLNLGVVQNCLSAAVNALLVVDAVGSRMRGSSIGEDLN